MDFKSAEDAREHAISVARELSRTGVSAAMEDRYVIVSDERGNVIFKTPLISVSRSDGGSTESGP